MYPDVHGLVRLTLYDQVVKSCPGQLRGKEAAHVGAPKHVGEGRFGHEVSPGGCRGAGGRKYSGADDKGVARAKWIASLLRVVQQQVRVESPAPQELFSYLKGYGFCLYVTRGKVDVCYLSV